jgi:hypothetical protein
LLLLGEAPQELHIYSSKRKRKPSEIQIIDQGIFGTGSTLNQNQKGQEIRILRS